MTTKRNTRQSIIKDAIRDCEDVTYKMTTEYEGGDTTNPGRPVKAVWAQYWKRNDRGIRLVTATRLVASFEVEFVEQAAAYVRELNRHVDV